MPSKIVSNPLDVSSLEFSLSTSKHRMISSASMRFELFWYSSATWQNTWISHDLAKPCCPWPIIRFTLGYGAHFKPVSYLDSACYSRWTRCHWSRIGRRSSAPRYYTVQRRICAGGLHTFAPSSQTHPPHPGSSRASLAGSTKSAPARAAAFLCSSYNCTPSLPKRLTTYER